MARKGKDSRKLMEDHPKPVHIINPQTMDDNVTDHDRLEEDDQLAHVAHRVELQRSLDRDESDIDINDIDPAPPEGNW